MYTTERAAGENLKPYAPVVEEATVCHGMPGGGTQTTLGPVAL